MGVRAAGWGLAHHQRIEIHDEGDADAAPRQPVEEVGRPINGVAYPCGAVGQVVGALPVRESVCRLGLCCLPREAHVRAIDMSPHRILLPEIRDRGIRFGSFS